MGVGVGVQLRSAAAAAAEDKLVDGYLQPMHENETDSSPSFPLATFQSRRAIRPVRRQQLCYSRYSTRGTHLVMGRGTSLATTENHCSESWGCIPTGTCNLCMKMKLTAPLPSH
jgi:hypothetical protein